MTVAGVVISALRASSVAPDHRITPGGGTSSVDAATTAAVAAAAIAVAKFLKMGRVLILVPSGGLFSWPRLQLLAVTMFSGTVDCQASQPSPGAHAGLQNDIFSAMLPGYARHGGWCSDGRDQRRGHLLYQPGLRIHQYTRAQRSSSTRHTPDVLWNFFTSSQSAVLYADP